MARGADTVAACRGVEGARAAVVDSLARCWNAMDGEDMFSQDVELKEESII